MSLGSLWSNWYSIRLLFWENQVRNWPSYQLGFNDPLWCHFGSLCMWHWACEHVALGRHHSLKPKKIFKHFCGTEWNRTCIIYILFKRQCVHIHTMHGLHGNAGRWHSMFRGKHQTGSPLHAWLIDDIFGAGNTMCRYTASVRIALTSTLTGRWVWPKSLNLPLPLWSQTKPDQATKHYHCFFYFVNWLGWFTVQSSPLQF